MHVNEDEAVVLPDGRPAIQQPLPCRTRDLSACFLRRGTRLQETLSDILPIREMTAAGA